MHENIFCKFQSFAKLSALKVIKNMCAKSFLIMFVKIINHLHLIFTYF